MLPRVSVICLCYNHERFIAEALDSVLGQTYPHLEVLVVDDASTDGSAAIIQTYCSRYPHLIFIQNEQNRGNTVSFNRAWRRSTGDFLIDFSTDDVMLPNRVTEQVTCFENLESAFGVVYTDVQKIDDASRPLGTHYRRDKAGRNLDRPPSGDLFAELLRRYFIDPTSMMVRREVLAELGGYDETLAYEDFDFWVRSSRWFRYFYLDQVLTRRRLHPRSLSRQVYKPGDAQLASTIRVCAKAAALVRTPAEREALVVRVKSEIRQAFFTENFPETLQLLQLLKESGGGGWAYRAIERLTARKVRLSAVRKVYYRLRYGL